MLGGVQAAATNLNELLAWLAVLVSDSPLASIVFDPAGNTRLLNRTFEKLTGYALADVPTREAWVIKSRGLDTAQATDLASLCAPDTSDEGMELVLHGKDGDRFLWYRYPDQVFDTADGQQLCLLRFGHLRREGERDTERLLATLTRSEFIEKVFETAPNVLYVHDLRNSASVYQNRNVAEVIGYDKAEILAMGAELLPRLMHPEDLPRASEHFGAMSRARFGDKMRFEYRMRHRDGSWRWFASIDTPFQIDAEGRVLSIIGTAVDTTEYRALEEQFRQAQKLEAVGQLAGGIAHDINNLLLPIDLSVDLLLMNASNDERRHLEIIRDASRGAADLTRQILAFSRKQILTLQPVDLRDVVEHFARMLRRLLGDHIQLDLRLADDLPVIQADRSQLEQVLLNLAVNARDAMPGGGTLTISARTERDATVLEVIDTGVGMDAHTLKSAFEPFFTTKDAGEGSGLGLATVHGIIEQHGATIELESQAGMGTRFVVSFPAAPAGTTVPRRLSVDALASSSKDERILVVEDDPRVRSLVVGALCRAGYDAFDVESSADALAVLESDQRLDLLISDVVMPVMTGEELRTHAMRLRPTLPVLFMSGYADDHFELSSGLAQARYVLAKPFASRELLGKVRDVLTRS